ncbi:MAG TPA: transposase [Ignavibacteriaceae bacterium]
MKELSLIQLYYYLCNHYNTELHCYSQRFSPNSSPNNQKITDEELLCIYFYCRRYENKHKKSEIYDYAIRYMQSWFPDLPNYANFNHRINTLHSAILALTALVLQDIQDSDRIKNISADIVLVDAFPIMLCSGKRQGKVAREIADKSYCATKGVYYHGVKMHTVVQKVEKKLPLIDFISITPASENDLTAFKPILPQLVNKAVFADKAYVDRPLNEQLMKGQNTFIYTPVKLTKGETEQQRQFKKAADDLFSTAVSRVRQPIESLFNWINEHTGLQNASKIRATNALFVHIFGAIITVLFRYIF